MGLTIDILIKCCVFCFILSSHTFLAYNYEARAEDELRNDECLMETDLSFESTKCKPRPQIVPITDKEEMIFPNSVEVNRCAGSCKEMGKCRAVVNGTELVKVLVNKTKRCEIREVVVHKECKCGFNVTEDMCTKKQKYDHHSGQCYCPRTKERRLCTRRQHQWDRSECTCRKCDLQCTTGFMVSEKECSCVPEGMASTF